MDGAEPVRHRARPAFSAHWLVSHRNTYWQTGDEAWRLKYRFFSKKNQDLPPAESASPDSDTNVDASTELSSLAELQALDAKEKSREREIKLPLIGHRTIQWQGRFLMTVLFFAVSFGIVFALLHWQRTYLTGFQTRLTSDVQRDYQAINTAGNDAIMAKAGAMEQLDANYDDLKKKWANLQALHAGSTTAGAEETLGGRSAYEATPELLVAAQKVETIWNTG